MDDNGILYEQLPKEDISKYHVMSEAELKKEQFGSMIYSKKCWNGKRKSKSSIRERWARNEVMILRTK